MGFAPQESLRVRLADEHDRRTAVDVGVADVAAGDHANVHRAQVARAHGAEFRRAFTQVVVALHRRREIPTAAERERRRGARAHDPRCRTQPVEHTLLEALRGAGVRELFRRAREGRGVDAVAAKAAVDAQHFDETRDEKSGAGEQHHRERRLEPNEESAPAAMGRRSAEPARSRAPGERSRVAGSRRRQPDDQSDDQARGERYDRGCHDDARIEAELVFAQKCTARQRDETADGEQARRRCRRRRRNPKQQHLGDDLPHDARAAGA